MLFRSVLATVKAALDADPSPNAANQAGDTALHAAAQAGFDTVVQYLVDKGADVNAKNGRGQTPLGTLSQGRGRRGGGAGAGAAAAVDAGAAGADEPSQSTSTSTAALLRKLGGTP